MEENLLNCPIDLNSPGKRVSWWNSLEEDWKQILQTSILTNKNCQQITDNDLLTLVTTPVIRIVGPTGPYPNFHGSLENLKGLSELTNLRIVVVMYCDLKSLEGMDNLTEVRSLFINNNKLVDLKQLENLRQLEELYCGSNQISSILPLNNCKKLKTLYCSNNNLKSLKGLSRAHRFTLKTLYCLPNEQIALKEIRRTENMLGIHCRSV